MEAPSGNDITTVRHGQPGRTWLVDLEALHARTGLGLTTLIAEALIGATERMEAGMRGQADQLAALLQQLTKLNETMDKMFDQSERGEGYAA